jgi:hypothetical protein
MGDLFDKLKEGAGQVISEMDKGKIQSAISMVRHQLAEADRKRKQTLLQQQVRDLHTQEAQAISSLSGQVLALHEAGTLTQPELISLCRNVDEIRVQLREREAELEQYLSPPLQQASPSTASLDQARCPKCGVAVLAGAAFCQSCGAQTAKPAPVPAPVLFCIHCGAQLRDNARFCSACGQSVT